MTVCKRHSSGKCIYCGAGGPLSDEHVIPFGLGGDLVLARASCRACAEETSRLERRLLRGHWWPYRLRLGLKSRRKHVTVPNLQVMVEASDGTRSTAELPMAEQSIAMIFDLAPPSILEGAARTDLPSARRVGMKVLGKAPSTVVVAGRRRRLTSDERITIPVNLDASDLCRFLAKVAHAFAICRRGADFCSEYFLPSIILGRAEGAATYVGGGESNLVGPLLPGQGLHAIIDRINTQYLSVYVQLFRDGGTPPPIYEVVVGRI